jgi:hypothetical protein
MRASSYNRFSHFSTPGIAILCESFGFSDYCKSITLPTSSDPSESLYFTDSRTWEFDIDHEHLYKLSLEGMINQSSVDFFTSQNKYLPQIFALIPEINSTSWIGFAPSSVQNIADLINFARRITISNLFFINVDPSRYIFAIDLSKNKMLARK